MRLAQLLTPLLLLSLISAAAAGAEQNIQWLSDLEAAKRIAVQTNRPILVHFWSQACKPCVQLEQLVYALPEVKREMEANFVLVKLNVDNEPGAAAHFGVQSWPADVILAPDGRLVARLSCPQVADRYLAQLAQVKQGVNPDAGAALAQASVAARGVAG